MDDDDDALTLAVRRLERSGAVQVCGVARDGEEALAAIDRLQPDVVVLDVQMPVLDGWGVLERLRGREPRPLVIVHSSSIAAGSEARARAFGAVAVLEKRFDDQLTQEVLRCLREDVRRRQP